MPVKKLKNEKELVELAIEDALELNGCEKFEDFTKDLKNDKTSKHLLDHLKDVLLNAILADEHETITIFDEEIDVAESLEQVSKDVKPVSGDELLELIDKECLPVEELKTKKEEGCESN